ncbi:MAG: UDP-N-acetylmuramoyl-L-alanyl-D-glutamate--2,6-diaminopimelate ligase [Chloroflexi bacterium]|uniref:UDP-N-acetylmuramoyl-L-alanyl-D-glutamate--2, 6-diaminopimelate ligase n=1 Tax=Candidatus Flexifilum breve TaxID=3140694 RepID=UPI003134EEE1|nr:UDP-N-acetylmuramoyl-L-alanyl-D-glutamate--2,6-diaminopimelate ligase [Chloroflexota bacterium]
MIAAPVVEADAELAPGGVFVARIGLSVDGHDFIPRAIEKGAAAIIGERPRADLPAFAVPYVQVEDAQQATGYLAAAYHDYPSRKLIVIGVTGTDGKTTTSTLIHRILQIASDGKAGLVSTIAAEIGSQSVDTGFHVTTPSAPQIQAFLAHMVVQGMRYAVLEMTSHGLAQGRLNGVDIDAAVLTNLTHEHMDYHKTFENYRAAKGRMFAMLGTSYRKPEQPKISVINADDANAGYFEAVSRPHPPTPSLKGEEASLLDGGEAAGADGVVLYGMEAVADVRGTDIVHHPGYTQFVVHWDKRSALFHLPLVGRFNVYNALAAIAVTRALNLQIEVIQRGLLQVTGIPGRLERIDSGQDYIALVDFAHTPNALDKALSAARTLTTGRVICVFGCAGLRDRDKRRMMPEIATRLADFSVFTAEDPRTEALDEILQTMADAATAAGGVEGQTFSRVRDRGQALFEACQRAAAGDVVIACGKGHEQSMAFGKTEYLWDDRDALRAAINGTPLKTLPTAE